MCILMMLHLSARVKQVAINLYHPVSTSPRYGGRVGMGLAQGPGSRCIRFDELFFYFRNDKLSQVGDIRTKETTADSLVRLS